MKIPEQQYPNEAALREAIAQQQHRENLESGGVYDEYGNLFSDLEVERRVAQAETLTFVHPNYFHLYGFKGDGTGRPLRYYRRTGYYYI